MSQINRTQLPKLFLDLIYVCRGRELKVRVVVAAGVKLRHLGTLETKASGIFGCCTGGSDVDVEFAVP